MQLDDLARVMADAITAAQAPLLARIALLEARGTPAAIVGEKGDPGAPGRDAAPVDLEAVARAAAALMPPPRDGVDGRDGRDGAPGLHGKDGAPGPAGVDGHDGRDGTLEQVRLVYDGERTLAGQYTDGTPLEGWSVRLPMLLDRGVYASDRAYETGDVVTYGGSAWIAKADSQGKQPGTNDGAAYWRLAVKRGNDGKPGTKGVDGKDGTPGPPGRDGTRSY